LIPHHLIPGLSAIANDAVDDALVHGAPGFVAPPTSEVGYVAAVVRGALRKIALQWIPILAGAKVKCSITGVFCHQSPKVRFTDLSGAPRTRELADLLIVHDNIARSGKITRRAALVQAKMAGAAIDLPQLHLYRSWPLFRIQHRAFHKKLRHFKMPPYLPWEDSGCYGIIDKGPTVPSWHCVVPQSKMGVVGAPTLGTFRTEMLNLTLSDRGRLALPGGKDDWSFTIDELLRITAQRLFKHKATMGNQRAPASSALQFITQETAFPDGYQHPSLDAALLLSGVKYQAVDYVIGGDRLSGGGGEGSPPDIGDFDDGAGVSVIRILTVAGD